MARQSLTRSQGSRVYRYPISQLFKDAKTPVLVWDYSSHTQFWCMSENSFDVLFDQRTVVGVEQSDCLNIVIRENIISTCERYTPVIFKKHSEQWMYAVHVMENEDVVLVGTFDSQMIKFDLHSGEILWVYEPFGSGPVNIIKNVNMTIFVGASDNFVIALDFHEQASHRYKSVLSMFKEVMNMHFFRRLRVKDIEEIEDQEEEEQKTLRKKPQDEEDEKKRQELRAKQEKMQRNMDVLLYNDVEIVYPTGNRRKRMFKIKDKRFVFDEERVDGSIFTRKQIRSIRKREKKEKKVYNYYTRIVISGKVRKEGWYERTNYLDISCLVKPLEKATREKWLEKERERRVLKEEVYSKPISVPNAENFEIEYSGRRSNRQKPRSDWCSRKKTRK